MFGTYKSDADSDGPFVYTGFKPALVITKKFSSTSSWAMWDNKRNPNNPVDTVILASGDGAESTESATYGIDFVANGFKSHTTSSYAGESATYIYMAWAEMPFKYATAR